MFVGTILACPDAPCHPEGEARGTFRIAEKVPPFGFAQGKRCARDDNIALAPVCAPRPGYISGGGPAVPSACWPKMAPWMSGENIACALAGWASRNSRCMLPIV